MSMRRTTRTTTRVTVSSDRGVFMISVAAELAEMHPQTLRMYEQRGLIEPKRSPKGTRLYSHQDVERLRRIQEMTNELGLNLAGVEHVLRLEQELDRTRRRMQALERRTAELQQQVEQQREALRRASGGQLVPLKHTRDILRARDAAPPQPPQGRPGAGSPRRIPVEREDGRSAG
ncbi:MAG TPA: helix-turn-helix transcriptional regulator [Baekduia sp.]|nr:helix-turn-helix transcriptional regulator [Baekduia sp.]